MTLKQYENTGAGTAMSTMLPGIVFLTDFRALRLVYKIVFNLSPCQVADIDNGL
jgi:hypothetical protein